MSKKVKGRPTGRDSYSKITFPREYLEEGHAWEMWSFHADGKYIVLKGSMDKWELIEEHEDGSLTYGKFNEPRQPEDRGKLH